MSEKEVDQVFTPHRTPRGPSRTKAFLLTGIAVGLTWFLYRDAITVPHGAGSPIRSEPRCPQVEPLFPKQTSKELDDLDEYLKSNDFRNKSIARLSGAVQIPTESFDDLGEVGVDPRWDVFYPFAGYLEKTFPLVHSTLQLQKINKHALLYTWPGSDPSLKPTLLMAHQDVVPVPESTVKQWKYPPFSGYYDGEAIWGRGSSDCKNQLIAILSAVEGLVGADFRPQRTLILSFGFDEEISGQDGANHLAKEIFSNYGEKSIAVIVDEGATTAEKWGQNFAMPGVAEKGYVDVDVVVRLPGGHSSIPPKHNGIGVASDLIRLIEDKPYEPYLDEENPYLDLLYCGAEYSPDSPKKLKHLLAKHSNSQHSCMKRKGKDELALEASKAGLDIKYLMTTSVAVDLISGGVKTNALPERTQFTVNHRVNVGSQTDAVLEHITKLAAKIADKYGLAITPFNGTESPESITLSHRDTRLEPAPVTPTNHKSGTSTPYSILSGTTRAIYGKDLLVAPGIMTGNTDTRYYWDLSDHIFRYGPGWDKTQEGLGKIHTVDEHIGVQGHVDGVQWFVKFVRNMDEADI